MEGKIKDMVTPAVTPDASEAAGRDAAINGANTANTHFKYFLTIELAEAWLRGKKSDL